MSTSRLPDSGLPALAFVGPLAFFVLFGAIGPCRSGPAHPEPNPRTGYLIEVSEQGGAFDSISITPDGGGCEVFGGHHDPNRTCLITTNTIPSVIGGEAHGDLNDRHTPELDALIWRARVDADASACNRGGLEGAFLAECESAAVDEGYVYESGPFRVKVPIGGAAPNESP